MKTALARGAALPLFILLGNQLSAQDWVALTNGVPLVGATAFAGGGQHSALAAYSGRPYLSGDAGATWTIKTNGLQVRLGVINAVHIRDSLLFASTRNSATLSPIVYSSDGGENWKMSAVSGLDERTTRIVTFASDSSVALAGDQSYGVFRSTDQGVTWALSNIGLPTQFNEYVVADLLAAQGKFFAAVSGGGIYVSQDGGASWSPAGQFFDENGSPTVGFLGKSLAEATDGTLYAMVENAYVYKSKDGGATWRRISHNIQVNPINFLHIAVSGTLLFALGQDAFTAGIPLRLYKTENEGGTWSEISLTSIDRPQFLYLEAAHGYLYLTGATALYRLEVGTGTPAGPRLSFSLQGSKLVLCWPTGAGNYVLEETASLAPGSPWNAAGGTRTENAGNTCISQPLNSGLRFFRLKES